MVNHCTGCGRRSRAGTAHSCGHVLRKAVASAPHTCGPGDHVLLPDHRSAGDLKEAPQPQHPAFLNLSSTPSPSLNRSPSPITKGAPPPLGTIGGGLGSVVVGGRGVGVGAVMAVLVQVMQPTPLRGLLAGVIASGVAQVAPLQAALLSPARAASAKSFQPR